VSYNIVFLTFSAGLAAKVARQDSLARFLSNRPSRQELVAKNIIPDKSEDQIHHDRQEIGSKLIRYIHTGRHITQNSEHWSKHIIDTLN